MMRERGFRRSGRASRDGAGGGGAPFEALEPRMLLAFDPTASEQYLLELFNRFRADPVHELGRLVSSLGTPAHSPYPAIDRALVQFGVSGSVLKQQFDALTPVAPLAWNADLYDAADYHTRQQIQNDDQQHQFPGEPGLVQRAKNFGYIGMNDGYSLGENIYAYSDDLLYGHAGFVIDWGTSEEGGSVGGIQSPPGHRDNMLDSSFTEIGIRVLSSSGPKTGPLVITQDLGDRSTRTRPYLTGVVYQDGSNDLFYSAGEGLGGVSVSVVGTGSTTGAYNTTSMSAGGWQLQVPAGTYNVTFSGAGFGDGVTYTSVIVGSRNVKVDARKGVVPPVPAAQIAGNGVVISNGDTTPTSADWTGFGAANTSGQSITRTFTLRNTGTADLSLAGFVSRVTISGVNASDFLLTMDAGQSLLAPGGSTTFSVRFNPSALGFRNATVMVRSNDPAAPVYTFGIQGRGIERGVASVSGRSNVIANGQTSPQQTNATTFGLTSAPGATSVRVFTVTNVGAGVLGLLGVSPVSITGPGAAFYRVSVAPDKASLNPGESATFRVRFVPTVAGAETATITLATSDTLNAAYSFVVRGTGVPVGRVQVFNGPGGLIANGDDTPSDAERTDFGSAGVGSNVARWYTIRNTGLADLALTAPTVTIAGMDAAEFVLPAQPAMLLLAPGASAMFLIRFRPLVAGAFVATVTIGSGDMFAPVYTFVIAGVGA